MDVLNFLFTFGLGGIIDDDKLDIITKLPFEVAIVILRMLDGATLLNVLKVSKRWYDICQSDKILRQKIRQHKNEMKLKKNEVLFGIVGEIRVPKDESTVFQIRNIQQKANVRSAIEARPVARRFAPQASVKTLQTVKKSEIPFVVLESNGNNPKQQTNGKRKRQEVRGIGMEQKRRLRRL